MSRAQQQRHQDRLEDLLDITIPRGASECVINLSSDLCYGESNCGGYSAALVAKAAGSYAAHHPRFRAHPDVRFSSTSLLRPVFPKKGPLRLKITETALSRLSSLLRVEGYQNEKLCLCADVLIADLTLPGITLKSGWELQPPPTRVDLHDLENHTAKDWICYHTYFHPQGFRRAQSYVKYFVPTTWSATYNEQWVLPGWDCAPSGSRDPSLLEEKEARWNNDNIMYLADAILPIQENFFPMEPGKPPAIGSMAATINFGLEQKRNRDSGRADWRDIDGVDGSSVDGFRVFTAQGNMVVSTLNLSVEVKRRLPVEGVRWLYVRTEVKNIQSGRFDLQALIFDETFNLVAIRNGVEQLVDPASKQERVQKI